MSSFCAHCGAPLAATARFCTHCGAANPAFSAEAAAPAPGTATDGAAAGVGPADIGPAGAETNATRASDRLRHEPAAVQDQVGHDPTDLPTAPYLAQPYASNGPEQPPAAGLPASPPPAPPHTAAFPPDGPTVALPTVGQVPPAPPAGPTGGAAPVNPYAVAPMPAAPGTGFEPPANAWAYGQPPQPAHQQPGHPQAFDPAQATYLAGDPGMAPAPTPRKSRKGLVALIGALVILLAAGGGAGWWFLLRDDSTTTTTITASPVDGAGEAPVKAITSAPTQAWSWEVPENSNLVALGDLVAVGGTDGVRVFGADDQPVWTSEEIGSVNLLDEGASIVWGQSASDNAVLVESGTGKTIRTFDGWLFGGRVEEGKYVLLQRDGNSFESPVKAAKVVNAAGDDVYDLPVYESFTVGGDHLYLMQRAGKLLKLTVADGQQVWSQDIDPWTPSSDEDAPMFSPSLEYLENTDTVMVLPTQTKLEVRSADTGAVTKTLEVDCSYLSLTGPTLVGCSAPVDYSADTYDSEAQRVTHFYDGTGEIGSVSAIGFQWYRAFRTGTAAEPTWYMMGSQGIVYDASFAETATFTGRDEMSSPAHQVNDQGLYVVQDDKLEQVSPQGKVAWSVEVPAGTQDKYYDGTLVATDDLVAVLRDGKITAWRR